jgi:nicotinamidase-related amidase
MLQGLDKPPSFGAAAMRLPDELRAPLAAHLEHLRAQYAEREWGGRIGFGSKPAVIVIDLALSWTDPQFGQSGSDVDSVVEATVQILDAARGANVPIFFTTFDYDAADPPSHRDTKLKADVTAGADKLFQLDPRLERRPTEKIIRKPYASSFKGTNLHELLTSLGVDTLIVTGVSTSHCVYATCRDGTDSFRIIVPQEAVGERCELLHMVNLFDIDIDLGDVYPLEEVVSFLKDLRSTG